MDTRDWQYKNEGACNIILSYTGQNAHMKPTRDLKLSVSEWKYKNEGIENVILSYCGSSHMEGHVLRVKKTSTKTTTHPQHDRDEVEFKFVRDVMLPRIGAAYVHPGEIIKVNPAFLQAVSNSIQEHRPPHRLVSNIDTTASSAFLLPDLSIFPKTPTASNPTFCVELKPKWGFVSSSPYIHPKHQIKTQACRYCLHQHLKLLQGSIKHISQYCPQDLYSNDPVRVRKALRAMLTHPQNNFKVYSDGELAFTGSLGGRKHTDTDFDLEHLSEKLKRAFPHSKDTLATLCDILVQILAKEPVLQNLKRIQIQDDIDIEAIYYLYKKHILKSADFTDIPDTSRFSPLDALTQDEISSKVNNFTIAATAKDCSVMIALLPTGGNESKYKTVNIENEGDTQYRIGVVDLDERAATLIPQYYKLDQEIISEYLRFANNNNIKLKCV